MHLHTDKKRHLCFHDKKDVFSDHQIRSLNRLVVVKSIAKFSYQIFIFSDQITIFSDRLSVIVKFDR